MIATGWTVGLAEGIFDDTLSCNFKVVFSITFSISRLNASETLNHLEEKGERWTIQRKLLIRLMVAITGQDNQIQKQTPSNQKRHLLQLQVINRWNFVHWCLLKFLYDIFNNHNTDIFNKYFKNWTFFDTLKNPILLKTRIKFQGPIVSFVSHMLSIRTSVPTFQI